MYYRDTLHAIDTTKALELLNHCMMLTVFRADAEIVRQVSAHYNGYVRFIG